MAKVPPNYRSMSYPDPFQGIETLRSRTSLAKQIGAMVYLIRTKDGLIKIGWTSDLAQRKNFFGGWSSVLAFVARATIEDEHALHARFAAHLARGREYFRPAPELISYINEIRVGLGVPLIAG